MSETGTTRSFLPLPLIKINFGFPLNRDFFKETNSLTLKPLPYNISKSALFLDFSISFFPTLPEKESSAILEFLYDHIISPEYTCRFHWEPNSIAIWDNRSTQHKPINDYFPAHRLLERIAIDGDKHY